MDDRKVVQEYYDATVEGEWERLAHNPHEFCITTAMMDRYIKPGHRVLDIGGGPGRYSIYYARRGCQVTLVDLSAGNVAFAQGEAGKAGVDMRAMQGDALEADAILAGEHYDHVFLMGPMYHLLEEGQRLRAMEAALALVKPGGKIYVSYIMLFSGMIYAMRQAPALVCDDAEAEYLRCVQENRPFAGDAFTRAYFATPGEIGPFMARFGLEPLHLFGQEGMLAPQVTALLGQEKAVWSKWLELAVALCERPELLAYSEHAMYIGQKPAL